MKLTLITILLLTSTLSFAGDSKGHGGDILSCVSNDHPYQNTALDYYELHEKEQLQIPEIKTSNEIDIVAAKLKLLKKRDLHRYLRMLNNLNTFYADVKWVDFPISNIRDTGDVKIPINCKLVQIINQNKNLLRGNKKYLIRKMLWSKLNPINKAMLILHELIYLDSTSVTSESIRMFNSFIFAEKIKSFNEVEYMNLQRYTNFSSYSYMGMELKFDDATSFFPSGKEVRIRQANPVEGSLFYYKNETYKMRYSLAKFHLSGIPKEFCTRNMIINKKKGQEIAGNCLDIFGYYHPIRFYKNGNISSFTVSNSKYMTPHYELLFGKVWMNADLPGTIDFHSNKNFKALMNTILFLKSYTPNIKIGGSELIHFSDDESIINSSLTETQELNIGNNTFLIEGAIQIIHGKIISAVTKVNSPFNSLVGKHTALGGTALDFSTSGKVISFFSASSFSYVNKSGEKVLVKIGDKVTISRISRFL
jgi:hypothetical protein